MRKRDKSFFICVVLYVDERREQIGFPDCALFLRKQKSIKNAFVAFFLSCLKIDRFCNSLTTVFTTNVFPFACIVAWRY